MTFRDRMMDGLRKGNRSECEAAWVVHRRGIALALIALVAAGMAAFGLHAYRCWDEFVFVTVEESSTSALAALPIGWERLPDTFVDCETRLVQVKKRPVLLGVSLGIHSVSSSQGIEFKESLRFSLTGKASVGLARPASVQGQDWLGNTVEMVNNAARVVRGDLAVEKTEASGVVHFRYGDKRFSLAPGQSWAELLAYSDGSLREIHPESWESEVDACLIAGIPVTRLAIANRGFWPKDGVREFQFDEGGGADQ